MVSKEHISTLNIYDFPHTHDLRYKTYGDLVRTKSRIATNMKFHRGHVLYNVFLILFMLAGLERKNKMAEPYVMHSKRCEDLNKRKPSVNMCENVSMVQSQISLILGRLNLFSSLLAIYQLQQLSF